MKQGVASAGSSQSSSEQPSGFQALSKTLLERLFQRVVTLQRSDAQEEVGGVVVERKHFSLLDRSFVSNSLVALLAPDTEEFRTMKRQIEEAGGTVMIITQREIPEVWLREYSGKLSHCIVGHDFHDAGAAVDFCLKLRATAPDLVVILTLADVMRHDFSAERMPICEVTLRRPVSRTPLFLGLKAATDNRAAFERRSELATDSLTEV